MNYNMKSFLRKYFIGNLIIILFVSLYYEYKGTVSNEILKTKIQLNNDTKYDNISYKQSDINRYKFVLTDFNPIEDVYKWIESGDRVIFIVRHSERWTDYSKQWALTPNGINLAINLWNKLVWDPFLETSTDFYWSTTVKRTIETSYYIWKSRWNQILRQFWLPSWEDWEFYDKIKHPIESLIDSYFWLCEGWLYDSNPDFTISKSVEIVNNLCNLTEDHPFSRFTTHDCIIMPLVERISNWKITFYWWERINFLAGIAIIVHEDWSREWYPVRWLDNWKMLN